MIVRSCVVRRTATPCRPLLRHRLHPFASPSTRLFHASAGQRAEMPNHYETLKVSTNATPKEIKKSFYTLSKANHPDLHPNDPDASQRFVKISEAYATLGSAEKKQRYDRDFLRSSPSGGAGPGGGPAYSGSHSSHMASSPGGRSPSGLSRRRTQFKGPPPSFYRSGGWGDQGAKRQEASEKASHTHEARGRAASNNVGGGMGPGGFTQGFADDVPHFDAQGHFKTHEQILQERVERNRVRARMRRKQGASFDDQGGGSTLFNFFVIGGVLGGIAAITGLFSASGGRQHVAPGKKKVDVGDV
ncbi:Putative DnaJ domain, Chaperone J-domain superfamily [Septoria linicola]|uniref:DnaJ domain, Chaperone J-domain superfamily n=1 Tax=Septoria linicola TaxID=215465 RepID=A0A9Q9B8S5_9PEZI|nr:Putative DnaJ domain, Chaperone J-domain superfamily [Septoria linicola]